MTQKGRKVSDTEMMDQAVQRGIRFLDNTIPDWRHLVNVDTLSLGDTRCCVLGQVFADKADWAEGGAFVSGFDYGYTKFFECNIYKLMTHGFETDVSLDPHYTMLNAAWERALQQS